MNFNFPNGSGIAGLTADISSVYKSILSSASVAATTGVAIGESQDRLSSVYIKSAQFVAKATQNGNLVIEQSEDGTTWNTVKTIGVIANVIRETGWVLFDYQYYRVKFANTSGATASVVVYQSVSSEDLVTPRATKLADSDIIQPTDLQSRKSTLIAAHNATAIGAGATPTAPTNYVDVTAEERISVQVSGSASSPHTISLLWSNDGAAVAAEEVIGVSRSASSLITTKVGGNFVKVKITNNDTVTRTFTTNILKSV